MAHVWSTHQRCWPNFVLSHSLFTLGQPLTMLSSPVHQVASHFLKKKSSGLPGPGRMPFISPPRPRSEMRRRRRQFRGAIRRRIWHHSGEALHTEDRGSISSGDAFRYGPNFSPSPRVFSTTSRSSTSCLMLLAFYSDQTDQSKSKQTSSGSNLKQRRIAFLFSSPVSRRIVRYSVLLRV